MNNERDFSQKGQSHPVISAMRRRRVHDKLREDAEAILRDVAFVLKMTQRVKQQILDETEEPSEAELAFA